MRIINFCPGPANEQRSWGKFHEIFPSRKPTTQPLRGDLVPLLPNYTQDCPVCSHHSLHLCCLEHRIRTHSCSSVKTTKASNRENRGSPDWETTCRRAASGGVKVVRLVGKRGAAANSRSWNNTLLTVDYECPRQRKIKCGKCQSE